MKNCSWGYESKKPQHPDWREHLLEWKISHQLACAFGSSYYVSTLNSGPTWSETTLTPNWKTLGTPPIPAAVAPTGPPDATTPDGAAIDALPPFGIAGATLAVDAFAAPAPQNLNVSDGDKIGGGHEVAPRRFPET